MNAVIHFFAAIGALVLVVYILRLQRRRDFLLQLLRSQTAVKATWPVRLGAPSQFLAEFSAALGVPFSSARSSAEAMAKINPRVWTETFLSYGFVLIRCSEETGVGATAVQVTLQSPSPADRDLAGELAAALGGQVRVTISSSKA